MPKERDLSTFHPHEGVEISIPVWETVELVSMPIFRPKDTPLEVLQKVTENAAGGYDGFIKKEGELAIGKLRLVGVYDDRFDGYFMLRTRVPGGRLSAGQTRVIGEVAEKFTRKPEGVDLGEERFLEITTRQDIQMHWIRIEDLPEIWDMYSRVGLTTRQACGNTTRNITSCAAHGISEDEVVDVSHLVLEATKYVLDNPQYGASLPRKFKTAITGSREDCIFARINDIAFTPATSDGEVGFNVWAGGGLSDYPRLASPLDLFVAPSEVLETLRSCLRLFMDLGDYRHAAINRFRLLVDSIGVEKVREGMQSRASFKFRPAGRSLQDRGWVDHVGVHRQKQQGLAYVGLNVPVGRLQGREFVEIADVAEEYGSRELRTTQRQNIMITNVGEGEVGELLEEPIVRKFPPNPKPFERAVVACTGAPFCKFGVFQTKQTGLEIIKHLDEKLCGKEGEDLGLKVHVSGCKASCAQLQIADIGLRATISKSEEVLGEAFDICLGGSLEGGGRLAEWVEIEFPVERAHGAAERLIRYYLIGKREGENFATFYGRIGRDVVQSLIRGQSLMSAGGGDE